MEKRAYEMLGIDMQNLNKWKRLTTIDNEMQASFKTRINELFGKINLIFEDKEIEDTEKVIEIDKVIQEMYLCIFSYMKLMSQETRTKYEAGELCDIDEDLKELQDNCKRAVEIDSSIEGLSIKSNAYQVLKLTPGAISDKKVTMQTLKLIKMTANIRSDLGVDEIVNQVFKIQRYMWANSKINTFTNRENYKNLQIAYENEQMYDNLEKKSKKSDFNIGKVERDEAPKSPSIPIHQTENSEQFSIQLLGRLQNKMIYLVEGQINEYALIRNVNGKEGRAIIYSNIDMQRLQKDSEYAKFVENMLFSPKNTIHNAKKYLGGYVGEIKTEKVDTVRGTVEQMTRVFNSKHIAMCRKYRDERNKRKIQETPSGDTQGDNGGR